MNARIVLAAAAVAALLIGCERGGSGIGADATKAGAVATAKSETAPESMLVKASEAVAHKDFVTAAGWYRRAADAGSPEAMYQLGLAYQFERGVRRDWNASKGWIQKAADKGYVKAQANVLARRYQVWDSNESEDNSWTMSTKDDLAPERLQQAIADLKKLSDAGASEATIALAQIFRNGLRHAGSDKKIVVDVPKDIARAAGLLTSSAKAGDAQAQLALLRWGLVDPATAPGAAEQWLELAGKSTDPNVVLDIARAFSLLGEPKYYNTRHLRGRSLTFSEANEESIQWYERASGLGSTDATFSLGQAYANGLGVSGDDTKAFGLYLRAADEGSIEAEREVARAYYLGKGVVKDWAKAFEWSMRAATHPTAEPAAMRKPQRWVASFYSSGTGVEKDPVLAYAWANIAASSGEESATKLRQLLEEQMTGEQVREAQALSSQYKLGDRIVRTGPDKGTVKAAGAEVVASLGTGFFFSSEGHVLTNAHVVDGCKTVRIPALGVAATTVVMDKTNDLAVVKLASNASAQFARLQDGEKIKQGQDIVVFGYPLDGYLPASGNVTPGLISALAGPGNNAALIQISAPVQPGNSGGPVLDRKGNIVGVVVGKADAIRVAKLTGDIPQNINFAISVSTLRSFLKSNGLAYSTPSVFTLNKDTTELADEARTYTVKVECLK